MSPLKVPCDETKLAITSKVHPSLLKQEPKWERVSELTFRLPVQGGHLYRYSEAGLVFVPNGRVTDLGPSL